MSASGEIMNIRMIIYTKHLYKRQLQLKRLKSSSKHIILLMFKNWTDSSLTLQMVLD